MSKMLRGNATPIVIAVVAVLVIAIGITLAVNRSKTEPVMMEDKQTEDAMMKKDEEAAMKKEDAMMKKDPMIKDDTMMKDDTVMQDDAMMMKKGSYEPYAASKLALAEKGDVVLFFRASWCPTCRALDADIQENVSAIPDGLTILDTNYDTETALKQKYGVTYQHTLVQVDASGKLLKKWTNSPTLAAIVTQVQ
ncbi:MAG: hypothetical protein RL141_978 [Candidatus Parcubacteria bacterium]|jgi:thiol-disulfide isomerase/thioredoxin